MSRRIPAFAFLGAFLALSTLSASGQQPDVRIAGSASTKPLLTGLALAMKHDKGLRVAIDTDPTSLDALDALAQDKAGIALVTKPLTLEDRSQYPDLAFVTIPIGMEVVALGVSDDLWNAGLHTITREAMRGIYEHKITNWRDAGGPDEKVTLFNFPEGQGVWEMFAEWLYGDNRKAPLPKLNRVASNEDARDALEFTPGSISPIAVLFVDGARCHALGIQLPDRVVRPTPEEVAAGNYPIVRPISAMVVGRPVLAIHTVTEFLTSPGGQALVRKSGAFGLDAVPKPPPDSGY